MSHAELSDREFSQFQQLIYRIAGISLSGAKKPLVTSRLTNRVRQHGHSSFGAYFETLMQDKEELQIAVDLLTTNETYFFREPKHMDFLAEKLLPVHPRGRPFRIWSAASSSGEEAYSLAMVLADKLGEESWEILGSDISTRVLEKARGGHYSLDRTNGIPQAYLKRYCLKGIGTQTGTFKISRALRDRVSFHQVNLIEPLPRLGEFDAIFLRNVMIYFDMETKRQVVSRLLPLLRPGGHFFISHSESLNGVCDTLKLVSPSIYRKP
ncbi:CheR family methyltransferase [Nitrincola sp. MINF-07-Sa-05]|uniref:CheR family methyltransferase n=1 Tax=Nitrincola salilacus TaxID=3400273 RepID=UPI003917D6E0